MRLSGRVALVTGAGGMRTIGHAIALRLAQDGADVVISDLFRSTQDMPPDEKDADWRGLESVAERVQAVGRRCTVIYCDISQPNEVEKMVEEACLKLGRLDILVNCARASIGGDRVPVVEMEESQWDRVQTVNLRGAMTCSKYVARSMIRSGLGGRIINISSSSSQDPRPNLSAYSASKAGLDALTRNMAIELAPHGILVSGVSPAFVDTNRVAENEWAASRDAGMTYAAWKSSQQKLRSDRVPLGRMGSPEDVAGAVSFLCSDDSNFITGEIISVSGGLIMR